MREGAVQLMTIRGKLEPHLYDHNNVARLDTNNVEGGLYVTSPMTRESIGRVRYINTGRIITIRELNMSRGIPVQYPPVRQRRNGVAALLP